MMNDSVSIDKPKNFESFWRNTLAQLAQIECEVTSNYQETRDGVEHHRVRFRSWANTEVYGYSLHRNDANKRPLIIYTHGYNGWCETVWSWAQQGFNVFGFDTRGFGQSSLPVHKDGWILTGIESASSSILRGAVCDYLRAAEVAKQLMGNNTQQTLFYGFSFGGAMALMAEALSQSSHMVAAGVPSFGWMQCRRRLVKRGSGDEVNRYIDSHPGEETRIMRTLAYFDTANFTPMIHSPCLIGLGLDDDVVPAETVRVLAERIAGPATIREFPVSHSDLPEESLWQHFETEWQQALLRGYFDKI